MVCSGAGSCELLSCGSGCSQTCNNTGTCICNSGCS
jgi:hypothetical protein